MSIQALNWAFSQDVSDPGQKLLLIALANRAREDTGECWPSKRLLTGDASMSESTIKRKMKELEDAGLVRREPRFDADGRQTSNIIFLMIGGGVQSAPPGDQNGGEGFNSEPGVGFTVDPPYMNPKNKPKEKEKNTKKENLDLDDDEPQHETPKQIEAWCRRWLVVQGADPGEVDDWFKVRKKKNGPITRTAIMAILVEARKANISVRDAVRLSAVNSWRGFRADWLENMKPKERASNGYRI